MGPASTWTSRTAAGVTPSQALYSLRATALEAYGAHRWLAIGNVSQVNNCPALKFLIRIPNTDRVVLLYMTLDTPLQAGSGGIRSTAIAV